MGKSGGSSSWLSAVKKAFRSPTKHTCSDKRSCRSEDLEQQEQEKKRGKRRWVFGKSLMINSKEETSSMIRKSNIKNVCYEADKRDAIEMAMATAAAAEAAVATAQAAVEFMRKSMPPVLSTQHHAAILIQKIFRAYLSRRALSALRGVVKLQALIRGHNVRKRTKMTLQKMQALIRVQAQVCDQRRRLSISNEDSFSSTSFTHKNLTSKDGEWDEKQSVAKEVDTISILKTNETVWKCERDLAYAFSNKIWRSNMEEYSDSAEQSEWNEKWSKRHQWERHGRYSCDQTTPIKIVQIDNVNPLSNNTKLNINTNSYEQNKFSLYSECSPLNNHILSYQSIIKPCQTQLKHLQLHSATPAEDELVYLKSRTPSLGGFLRSKTTMPSYMAETASTKARVRSQSAPRQQRPSTPEREGAGIPKRRLLFGTMDEQPSPSCTNLMMMKR